MTTQTPKPLTTGVIARLTGVAPRTVSKWIDGGLLVGYRIPLSKDRRVEVSDLRTFMNLQGLPTTRLDEYLSGLAVEDSVLLKPAGLA